MIGPPRPPDCGAIFVGDAHSSQPHHQPPPDCHRRDRSRLRPKYTSDAPFFSLVDIDCNTAKMFKKEYVAICPIYPTIKPQKSHWKANKITPPSQHHLQAEAEAQVFRPALPPRLAPLELPSPKPLHRRSDAQKGLSRADEAARPLLPLRLRAAAPLLPAGQRHPRPAPQARPPFPASFPDYPHRPRRHQIRALGRHAHGPRTDERGRPVA